MEIRAKKAVFLVTAVILILSFILTFVITRGPQRIGKTYQSIQSPNDAKHSVEKAASDKQ